MVVVLVVLHLRSGRERVPAVVDQVQVVGHAHGVGRVGQEAARSLHDPVLVLVGADVVAGDGGGGPGVVVCAQLRIRRRDCATQQICLALLKLQSQKLN